MYFFFLVFQAKLYFYSCEDHSLVVLDPETLKVEKEMELEGDFNYYLMILNTCTCTVFIHVYMTYKCTVL